MADEITTNGSRAAPETSAPLAHAPLIEEMTKAGLLYGRKKSKTHPRMRKFIHATRSGIEIFDLEKTLSALEGAEAFLKEMAAKPGALLFVATQPEAGKIIEEMAKRLGFPYVVKRWLGGTLTNFKTLSLRIQHFISLRADKAAGRLDKYTKKERVLFDRELGKLETLFGGIETMTRAPDAVIIVDPQKHETALRETKRLGIPVVALTSSDSDPEEVAYPIPANASARASISWILARLETAIAAGKSAITSSATPKA